AVRAEIESMFNRFIDEDGAVITRVERQRMLEQIVDEILGFGPIQPLLNDDSVTEVMVNGPFRVYVERKGKLQLSDVTFQSDEHRSEEHTSELQSLRHLVCRLLLE